MYAIIRNEDGTFYTSLVFGYYCRITADEEYEAYVQSIHNRYYIVLNQEKTALVRKYPFPREKKYLDPMVLITEDNTENWSLESENDSNGCIDILVNENLEADPLDIDETALDRCIHLDKCYTYESEKQIATKEDMDALMCVSGYFHDGRIKSLKRDEEGIDVIFDGIWGCSIEMRFYGDAECDTESRDPDQYDPFWSGATLLKEKEYYWLIDDDDMTLDKLTKGYCWFKAKNIRYKVVPNAIVQE